MLKMVVLFNIFVESKHSKLLEIGICVKQ